MKVTINVECTPEEARRYMGLPDVAPMQETIINKMQEQMLDNVASMQPAEMMKTWLPLGVGWLCVLVVLCFLTRRILDSMIVEKVVPKKSNFGS